VALMIWGTGSLLLHAAFGYSIATMGMKIGSTGLTILAIVLMTGGFLAAAASEIIIPRTADLGIVYITIIGIETVIVLS
jgi:small multidrug resistance pump